MQYLCVMAGFDEETQRHLKEIFKKLKKEGFVCENEEIPPHIFLGRFSVLNGNGIVERMQKTSAELSRFAVCFHHFGLYQRNKQLILSLSPSQKLLALKQKFGETYDWAPCIPLFEGEPELTLAAVPVLAEAFEEFDGIVDRLYLYEFSPTVPLLETILEGELK